MSTVAAALRDDGRCSMDPVSLAQEGEMGALVREYDWSRSSIGPPENWSQSLKMMVKFLLADRFPLLLWWGSSYVQIYNDAYCPVRSKQSESVSSPTPRSSAKPRPIGGAFKKN